jgi:long-chain acyl-CoA synthetase
VQLRQAAPHYFQNVPLLLERMRSGIEAKLGGAPPPVPALFVRARAGWERRQDGREGAADAFWLGLARRTLFRRVRRGISPNLRALICGSAPLAPSTQGFFEMLGIPVLQVYGLTETTAICTMDRPSGPRQLGRVGAAIPGIEMQLDTNGEILVRGPHLFSGYWRRPEATAAVLRDGWLHTGDRGDVDGSGNWRILGRVRNVLVLASGHNVAPDPLEERLRAAVPGAEHVLVVGHERAHLVALFTGDVDATRIEAALERIHPTLPHYERVRAFHIHPERFTLENGCLTANGKLKRDVVIARLAAEIEALYGGAAAGAGSGRP